jgi:hypothetical protein
VKLRFVERLLQEPEAVRIFHDSDDKKISPKTSLQWQFLALPLLLLLSK